MFVASAVVVVVLEVGTLGFDRRFLPAVGCFAWTLRFGGRVVVLVDGGPVVDGGTVAPTRARRDV
jgi:hypothetical protein